MARFTKNIAAGNNFNFLGFIDSRGYLVGSTTSAPAAGAAGSPMIRVQGAKTAAPAVPEPEVVQVTGDDTLLGEFEFDSIAQRSASPSKWLFRTWRLKPCCWVRTWKRSAR